MTTANSTLRRELEEARQRAGDAEARAAWTAADRERLEWWRSAAITLEAQRNVAREQRDEALQALDDMRHERDQLRVALKSEREELERTTRLLKGERTEARNDRALEARNAVADLYHAMHGDDQPRRDGLERARKRLAEWGML